MNSQQQVPDRRRTAARRCCSRGCCSRRHRGEGDESCAAELDITSTAPDHDRPREARTSPADPSSQPGGPLRRPVRQAGEVIPADPETAWKISGARSGRRCRGAASAAVRRRTRRGRATSPTARLPGRVDPYRRGPAPVVLTNHRIVVDGWPLPILLQEIFASYYGQRLPAPALSQLCHLAGRSGPRCCPSSLGEMFAGFDPDPGGPPGRSGSASKRGSVRVPTKPRGPLASWRVRATPRSTRCCRPAGRRC